VMLETLHPAAVVYVPEHVIEPVPTAWLPMATVPLVCPPAARASPNAVSQQMVAIMARTKPGVFLMMHILSRAT
jgi:hypothetical protein